MLLQPVGGRYEQVINTHYIEKLDLGLSTNELNEEVLARFLHQLDKPMPADERILWPDNEKFFTILQQELNKLDPPVRIGLPK
jgi:hypothetical protein